MCCSRKYPYSAERFLGLNPPQPTALGHLSLASNFPFPYITPLQFTLALRGMGMDIFWNHAVLFSTWLFKLDVWVGLSRRRFAVRGF